MPLTLLVLFTASCGPSEDVPPEESSIRIRTEMMEVPGGQLYFGQPEPGREAQPFGEAFLATRPDRYVRSVTFSPDGREAYWAIIDPSHDLRRWIVGSRLKDREWTPPSLSAFSQVGNEDDVPAFSPDGRQLFFLSRRTVDLGESTGKERIWFVSRQATGWSEPELLPESVNGFGTVHQQLSLDGQNNLYFACEGSQGQGSLDIHLSLYAEGEYQEPETLGTVINGPEAEYSPFISPDGDYLIFTRNIDDGWTLFLSFRTAGGSWTPPVDLRDRIVGIEGLNLDGAFVTRDGRFLIFFGEKEDTATPYWMDTSLIEDLRTRIAG